MDRKTAVLFPGQGCQYGGMGKFLYDHFPEAKLIFEEANDTLGFDIKSLCFAEDSQALTVTENAQPAILAVGYASYRVFQKRMGFIPQFMAGHSLGEYTALTCAEAIRFSDALKIVRKRGELMQKASLVNPGIMVAVSNISSDIVEELGGENRGQEDFAIANYNSPLQTVISGRREKVDKAVHALRGRGADIFPLNVSGPFHSSLMKESAGKLKEELQKYTFRKSKVPVISNVDVQVYQSSDDIINSLERQMTSSVRWSETMLFLAEEGVEIIIDTGPKTIIGNLSLQNSAKFLPYSLDKAHYRTHF